MKFNKDKIEAAKILTAEILELNQILPENRCVLFEITGILNPAYIVTFCVRNPKTQSFKLEKTFTVLLSTSEKDNCFPEICAHMKKWKEFYCR